MTDILIVFILIILLLALLLTMAVFLRGKRNRVDDSQYLDEEGDHMYYDRSRIEKREFARNNPGVKDVRSFRRLFKGK
jgi:hypothetical protein